ncbi:MAG: helix-turn-helix domain-containing protein [Candidatus Korobacteraceae bacterium]
MYSVFRAAQLLGVSPSLIRKLIRNRQIDFVRIGRCIRIPQQAIDTLILSGTATPPPAGGADTATKEAQ